MITVGALWGSVDQVTAPLIWTAWAGLGVLVLGFALTMVFPGRTEAVTSFDELAPADRGPQKA